MYFKILIFFGVSRKFSFLCRCKWTSFSTKSNLKKNYFAFLPLNGFLFLCFLLISSWSIFKNYFILLFLNFKGCESFFFLLIVILPKFRIDYNLLFHFHFIERLKVYNNDRKADKHSHRFLRWVLVMTLLSYCFIINWHLILTTNFRSY